MSDYIKIPYYSLKPNQLVAFERPEQNFFSDKQKESFKNLEDRESKYNELSSHARKRLQTAIDFLMYISDNQELIGTKVNSKQLNDTIEIDYGVKHNKPIKYKLTFITLTLSAKQTHTDEEIKSKLLNQFLTVARKNWQMHYYIWKAEKQENGNIHFHILTNIYIKHSDLRTTWNGIQNKRGFNYVDRYSQKMQNHFKNGFLMFPNDTRSKEKQYKAYLLNRANNWTNPNSTDIHALYKVKNVAAYMAKYMTKGVTKTERTTRMNELYEQIEANTKSISDLELKEAFADEISQIIENLKADNEKALEELNQLKAKGVSGRIWGQSQKLSKLKNFSDVQHFDSIPDIQQVINNSDYQNFIDLGNSQITVFGFDIKKTKHLKTILDKHITQCLQNKTVNEPNPIKHLF